MSNGKKMYAALILSTIFFFGFAAIMESSAWARAGGGRSFGGGSRSFSAPRGPSPSTPAPGAVPGRNPNSGAFNQPSPGSFGRSPFMTGLVGGLAGGFLGSMLFGGISHAAPGAGTGGGIGFLDILLIGLLLFFAYRFFKRRRAQSAGAVSHYDQASPGGPYGYSSTPEPDARYYGGSFQQPGGFHGELEGGIEQIRRFDPNFDVDTFRDTAQDIFFRIQAGWMNRSIDGMKDLLTDEVTAYFTGEFDSMKQNGVINRLENIAVRKVELVQAWQELGKDYVTVLFTANLLDYTVDESTGQLVSGDRSTPVKFQEFWTFTRDMGSSHWKLSAVDQVEH